MKNLSKISVIATLLLPSFALAATFESILSNVNSLIEQIIPIIMGVAFAYFLYGIVVYIRAASDETAKVKGKEILINGVIGLFVMVGVWGLVNVIELTFFGMTAGTTIITPRIP